MSRIAFLILLLAACSGVAVAGETGAPPQVGDDDSILLTSWSPDASRLLTSTGDGVYVRLWDVASGRVLWKANVARFQDDVEPYTLRCAAWSRDGRLVATGTDNGKLQLWNAATGELLWSVRAYESDVSAIALSPDASLVVSSADSDDGRCRVSVRGASDGRLVRESGDAAAAVIAIRFLDATRFETGDLGGNVTSWTTDAAGPVATRRALPGPSAKTSHVVAYSADFGRVAVSSWKELVELVCASGRRILRVPVEYGEPKASFSADGRLTVAAQGVSVFDARGRRLSTYSNLERGVLSPDGASIAATDYGHRGVQIFGTDGGRRRAWLVGHPGVVTALAFDGSGARFASAGTDDVVRVWDARTRRVILELEGHEDVKGLAFGLDGRSLESASEDETVVWDLATGLPLHREKASLSFASGDGRVLSPSGKLALVEEYEKPFRLVDAATGATVREFELVDQLDTLTFCPDERRFLAKPWWSGYQLRSLDGGGPIREFDVGYSHGNVVAFAPDGRTFVVGGSNQNLAMFDLETGATLWSLFPIDREEYATRASEEARRVEDVRRRDEATKRADDENARYTSSVMVAFDHFGDMTDPGELRLAESSDPKKSKVAKPEAEANAAWLRLRNDSPLPVEVPTQSMYLSRTPCAFAFPNGASVDGLCDGAEIAVWMGLEDASGKALPYGFDFGSSAILLPHTSVVFAVPRAVLANGNAITFGVTFQRPDAKGRVDDSGSAFVLRFRERDLPAR